MILFVTVFNLQTEADQYYQTWEIHAIASDRIVLNFGGANSGLIYNLYADRILGLNVVKESVSFFLEYEL